MNFMNSITYQISSPSAMIELGQSLTQIGHKFLVNGILWAGKTHLCKWFAESLWLDPSQVHSPTYVYYHEYEHKLFHGDFYRIDDPTTLTLRGIIDTMEDYDYCFIERPNFPEYYVDSSRHIIMIEYDPSNEKNRLVSIKQNT